MKALIERQLYRPAVVMPLLILMGLMVTLDFNLVQVTFVAVLRSSRYVLHMVVGRFRVRPPGSGSGSGSGCERTCHC
jgi:hypothetical protein